MHSSRQSRISRSRLLTRRRFLGQSAVGVVGTIGCPAILHSAAPNSMLQVAGIGVGGMGGATLRNVAGHAKVKVVALCDVDGGYLDQAAKAYPDASRHNDWRAMLTGHADRFDAVTIGTPDHMHAAPAVVALRAGKHVYLQKPMAGTLHECRVITEEAAKRGLVTQLGNQGRSSVESRLTVELLRSGAIGKIKEVILWENKPLNWWPKNTELRKPGDKIPAGLDWDLWLGVRQPRPYLEDTYHPKNWRAWFDFGVGEMGDMGCHHFDITFDALRLTAPLRVRQTTPGSSGELWGKRRIVELIFPGSELTSGDTVKLTWHDGDLRPEASRIALPKNVKRLPESGTFWIGEHGSIFKNYRGGRPVVLPEDRFPAERYPADPAPQDHYHDWVNAIFESRKACADFSHGGPLTEAVLVGAMADRVAGEWLEWDGRSQTFTNSQEATSLVRRPYREGWQVEGLG
ncbi:MAG: Gfo/Idh/MocA family oxidoreductase [Planctomycetes bacterium]|nr:Gfo/Idh/MocA family oxidoreductase [Planctomycetota bacterium]